MQRLAPALLLVIGLSRMAGDLLGVPWLAGLGAATVIAPAPKVFSSVDGLETYSTRFFLEWTERDGSQSRERSVELTSELCVSIRGPYNRRNVYGAALAYGPVLAANENARPMLHAVLRYALAGERPLLKELGLEPTDPVGAVRLRYEPIEGTDMGTLPRLLEVPSK